MLTPQEWHTRFTAQARWTAALRKYLFQQLHLPGAARLLEVGCGTGAILSEFHAEGALFATERHAEGAGFATEASEQLKTSASGDISYAQSIAWHGLDIDFPSLQLCVLNAPGAVLSRGDASCLPYAHASFDAVFCHFLLLWIENPVEVVAEMKRVARPGAAVLALAEPDYGGRIDYPQELELLGCWQRAALSDMGADPSIGRKLAAIFRQAGLQNIQTGLLGGQWRMDDAVDASEWQMLKHDLSGTVSDQELAQMEQVDMDARRKGERILFVPTFYALGWVD